LRERRNFGVRNFCGRGEFFREIAETRTEDQSDARAELSFGENDLRGMFGATEFHAWGRLRM
jgi:hypothetical protein